MNGFKLLGLVLSLWVSVSSFGQQERCRRGERCLPSTPRFDADYICRVTSYSGRGYPLSRTIGDRYICSDLGYPDDGRIYPGGNRTGSYVCCSDPYRR